MIATTTPPRSVSTIVLLALAVCVGIAVAYMGSRPHFDDAGIQAGLLLISAGALGAIGPDRPWLWALAVGIWTPVAGWLVASPPDPRSKPLPLPGDMLTDSALAQALVGGAIILLFPLVGAYAGVLCRRMLAATPD